MSTALLFGTTACSGSSDKADTPGEAPGGAASGEPAGSSGKPSTDTALPDIPATQVVAGLTSAGYKCGADGSYAICTADKVSVWVLAGTHPRSPVVSLHAAGPVATATAEIGSKLPQVLEVAHINPRTEITDWFGKLGAQPAAQLAAGDWKVGWSTEVGTEEPGAHLTLEDQLCKVNCQPE
ncbi:hypothetical protein [Kribbella sp. CA-293567]|uniref:hypothetical protein n=1 Tax=Kribbella sp. CA-293567 TaxID=3002436 RepID=UPI0022DE128D|nr:hypothetical protein [Kribbella sp. CA-293567]WBQ07073.1 hypothetical protein OX958_09790 [Kribbella sp. CA-293567]